MRVRLSLQLIVRKGSDFAWLEQETVFDVKTSFAFRLVHELLVSISLHLT